MIHLVFFMKSWSYWKPNDILGICQKIMFDFNYFS